MLEGIDHVAIVVRDTERALRFWRDTMGLPVVLTTSGQDGAVKITNLGLGEDHLQLLEPLSEDHPLSGWLGDRDSSLHHLGIAVADVRAYQEHAVEAGLAHADTPMVAATREALFLDADATRGVMIEIIEPLPREPRS